MMDPKEKAFKDSLPDRRLSTARQEDLLSELLDKTRQEDLQKFAGHLKPYLPLLTRLKAAGQPPDHSGKP